MPTERRYKRTELGKLTVEVQGNTVDLWIKGYDGDESLATVDRQELLAALEVEVDDPATHPADCLCDESRGSRPACWIGNCEHMASTFEEGIALCHEHRVEVERMRGLRTLVPTEDRRMSAVNPRIIEPYIWRVVRAHGLTREGAGPIPDLNDGDRVWMEVELQSEPDYHVIEFREDGWTLKHPLSCRPNLFDCKVNRVAEAKLSKRHYDLGRFRCELDKLGRFVVGKAVD